ncbi:MAG: hypothetical protein IPJ90_03245 [Anaerolineaceae bacterium]|nr:hypothetical protein [Anaerolineaceae bacterium]
MNQPNSSSDQCPECGGRLVFAADGRSRQCERCNHKLSVVRQRETPQELMRLQQFSVDESGFANVRTAGYANCCVRRGAPKRATKTKRFTTSAGSCAPTLRSSSRPRRGSG